MPMTQEKVADLRLKYLEMVQAIVTRMAGYSATLKNFCLTIVTAIGGYAIMTKAPTILALGLLPIIIFALLDALYLRLERRFRCLYDVIRQEDWTAMPSFEITLTHVKATPLKDVFLSWSIGMFYIPLATGLVLTFLVVEMLNVAFYH